MTGGRGREREGMGRSWGMGKEIGNNCGKEGREREDTKE